LRRRELGHRGVPTEFISKFRSVEEKEYVACQMVTDLSMLGNMIRIIS
jgi:hypothetical protein